MTPEQIKRIVKVCERIGWPKSSTNFLEWDKLACGWYWYGQPLTRQMSYAEDNAEAILEKYFRQWLESKWLDVITRKLPDGSRRLHMWHEKSRRIMEIEDKTGNYLNLLLTAVERTLEQENTK